MKKLILLLLGVVFLLGCEKQEVKKDLIGCWLYQNEVVGAGSLSLWLHGIVLDENKRCQAIYYGVSNGTVGYYKSNSSKGKWNLTNTNTIKFDWGKTEDGGIIQYPKPGKYELALDEKNENIIYINGDKFVRILMCDSIITNE